MAELVRAALVPELLVVETGVEQFLVQDPDGYLIRFSQPLGERRGAGGTG